MNLIYAFALIVSTAVSLSVAVVAWQRRHAPGAIGLLLLLLGISVWTSTYAVRWLRTDLASQYFWLDATYFGVVMVPFAMLIFTLQSTRREHLITGRNLALFAVVPVLTLILLWTDDKHGLFYAGYRTTGTILNGGPWFWVNVIYSYSINLFTVFFFIREFTKASHIYRKQMATIVAGVLLPWVGNVISFAGWLPFENLDITPFVFLLSALVYLHGLLNYGLLDVVPVAHGLLIERLPDGILVLDALERIVEINPAACNMTGVSPDVIGKAAKDVLAHWKDLTPAFQPGAELQYEIQIPGTPARDIEVRSMPLTETRGSLVLLREVTERKQMEEKLKQLSIRDVLTGLYNRAYFEDELARLERGRSQQTVSLIMMDVDGLKTVNDLEGHAAGDELLRRTAQVLNSAFRTEDIITRIGGDEFVVFLPNTTADAAQKAVDRVRAALVEESSRTGTPILLSIGVSTADRSRSVRSALREADKAMYAEKKTHHAVTER